LKKKKRKNEITSYKKAPKKAPRRVNPSLPPSKKKHKIFGYYFIVG